jgi:putative DNA base modification enzyme with NMAD domain
MNSTRGLLVRVGIDSSCGEWNAPCDIPRRSFVYIPIPESKKQYLSLATSYDEFKNSVGKLNAIFPAALNGQATHLDPDFRHLTYGDQGQRAARIRKIVSESDNSFLVFYVSLRDVQTSALVYAMIGFYWIAELVEATAVTKSRWHENAHTRRKTNDGDIVVRAVTNKSGRLDKFIAIGSYRDRAYRIDKPILDAWGGLDVQDGYVQRSAFLPEFRNPSRFLDWLSRQKVNLLAQNY